MPWIFRLMSSHGDCANAIAPAPMMIPTTAIFFTAVFFLLPIVHAFFCVPLWLCRNDFPLYYPSHPIFELRFSNSHRQPSRTGPTHGATDPDRRTRHGSAVRAVLHVGIHHLPE